MVKKVENSLYEQSIESAANYNKTLKKKRNSRIPYLDIQTNIFQSPCDLYNGYKHRRPGRFFGQIYTYPQNRWKYPLPTISNDKTSEEKFIVSENDSKSMDKWSENSSISKNEEKCSSDYYYDKKRNKRKFNNSKKTNSKKNEYIELCDFCLGTKSLNLRTNMSEDMIKCNECNRTAHTSCLKFNTSMKAQILTYPWQCIECKTCWVCKLSDNDEKMLFCDGCDRGYHMYCLNPPMENPPDEKWICLLCYKNQSNMNFNFNVGDN